MEETTKNEPIGVDPEQPAMSVTDGDLFSSILKCVKDLNILVRAANLRGFVVDSSSGPLTGDVSVSVSPYAQSVASYVVDTPEKFNEIHNRALAINGQYNPVPSGLGTLSDGDKVETINQLASQVMGEATQTPEPLRLIQGGASDKPETVN